MSATHATSKTLSLLDLIEAPAAEVPAPASAEKPKKRPSVFGIEGEAEYVDIANARIAAWKKGSP